MKKQIVSFIRKLVGTGDMHKDIRTIRNSQLFRGVIENCEWLKYK